MCRRISCKQCGKPTWAGCGAHVEQVLGDVAQADRCRCATSANAKKIGAKKSGFFATVLGRGGSK